MKAKYTLFFLLLVIFSSCSYLDFEETNGLKDKENVYKYFSSTKQVLTGIYSYLPKDFGTVGGAMRDCASDDAEYADVSGKIQDFNTGNWSARNVIDDSWSLYNGVRSANSFLKELESVDFSRYEYDESYKKQMEQLKTFGHQARILRATFFFELARRYGDIPMPLTVLTEEEDRTIEKTKFTDVISFIISECDNFGSLLPDTYNTDMYDKETGRVTRGYAMALKSKALLYAASPLHNPEGDVQKWNASAKAAWELINSGLYQLDGADKANNPDSKEVVLAVRTDANWDFELKNFPIRFTFGKRTTPMTATFPTQNLVDAFETKNGYNVILGENGFVSDDPAFNKEAPYANRDPRFARAILADNMVFKGSNIDLRSIGIDNLSRLEGGTPTGYFLKKYIIESTNMEEGKEEKKTHAWVVYRYAETLLTYAESMFYATGSFNDGGEYGKSALQALNEVRKNAGMPDKNPATNSEFEGMLRNEWRVEFAFEDHRFWDVRRWKIGNDTQKQIYGVEVTESGSKRIYTRKIVEHRVWKNGMELYPIPQEKILINPNLLPQNGGWN